MQPEFQPGTRVIYEPLPDGYVHLRGRSATVQGTNDNGWVLVKFPTALQLGIMPCDPRELEKENADD